jgi:hypothetical protein
VEWYLEEDSLAGNMPGILLTQSAFGFAGVTTIDGGWSASSS